MRIIINSNAFVIREHNVFRGSLAPPFSLSIFWLTRIDEYKVCAIPESLWMLFCVTFLYGARKGAVRLLFVPVFDEHCAINSFDGNNTS